MRCSMISDGEIWICRFCGAPLGLGGRVPVCDITERPEPVQVNLSHIAELPTLCDFRGESLRVEQCAPCQSRGSNPEIFACDIHGECTLGNISKRKPDGTRWQACSTCEDRKTPP
jgi:hypothetical protein